MRRIDSAPGGFSLTEVAMSLWIISFALVALIGVLPLGIENSRMSISETRAAQLVRMVTATLVSEPFTEAPCFSRSSTLNLAVQASCPGPGEIDPARNKLQLAETPSVVLYASYDPPGAPPAGTVALAAPENPQIIRATVAPEQAAYRIELRFRPEMMLAAASGSPTTPAGADYRVTGTTVLIRVLTIAGESGGSWQEHMSRESKSGKRRKGLVLETQAFIPAFNRIGAAK